MRGCVGSARVLVVIGMILVLGACAKEPPAIEPPLELIHTIAIPGVKGPLGHLGVDLKGARIFVVAPDNDSVEVIDVGMGKHVYGIAGVTTPRAALYSSQWNRLVISSSGDNRCRIYDNSLRLVGTVEDMDEADDLHADPNGRRVWVALGSGAVGSIDVMTAVSSSRIRLDGRPEAFAVTAEGRNIYVCVPSAGHVAMLDTGAGIVTNRWPVEGAKGNYAIDLDAGKRRLYVACREPAKLLVIDLSSGKTLHAVDAPADAGSVFFDAQRRRVYVTGGDGTLSAYQVGTGGAPTLLATLTTAPGAGTGLFVAESSRLYVAVAAQGAKPAQVLVYKVQ